MRYELADQNPTPKKTQVIIVNGREIGRVDHCVNSFGDDRYHAVLNVGASCSPTSSLAQGHASTIEDAIANAISDSRELAHAYLHGLDDLAEQLGLQEPAAAES